MKSLLSIFILLLLVVGQVHAGVLSSIGESALKASSADIKQPTLVLAPNIRMNIGGNQVVNVVGEDLCPKDLYDHLTGLPAQSGCVVLNKQKVTVHYMLSGKPVVERWEIKQDGVKTSLIRPDNSFVYQDK